MRTKDAALLTVAVVALLGGGITAASAATPGFAVYKVQLSSSGHTYALTVNETVTATSSPSTDNLVLKIAAQSWNFNYSRSINSSAEVSPFVPSITNQSYSFGSGGQTGTLSVVNNGTEQIQFAGHSYSLSSYSIMASATVNGTTSALNGALTTFPSGLVYSVKFSTNGVTLPASTLSGLPQNMTGMATGPASVSVTLLSTSLPLSAASPSTAAQAATIGVGAGAAVSALALGLGVRHRAKQNAPVSEDKPEHWVD